MAEQNDAKTVYITARIWDEAEFQYGDWSGQIDGLIEHALDTWHRPPLVIITNVREM
jgi:hypothetical protein